MSCMTTLVVPGTPTHWGDITIRIGNREFDGLDSMTLADRTQVERVVRLSAMYTYTFTMSHSLVRQSRRCTPVASCCNRAARRKRVRRG
jgi:hypothetical protein